ncbi:MAG: hypothetical protein ABW106_16040 [Steroidobacteraceae bacterium]
MMMSRMEAATNVSRLYEQAAAERALVEIELDTQQLHAITREEAAAILKVSELHPTPAGDIQIVYDQALVDSLEKLLKVSWSVLKA